MLKKRLARTWQVHLNTNFDISTMRCCSDKENAAMHPLLQGIHATLRDLLRDRQAQNTMSVIFT